MSEYVFKTDKPIKSCPECDYRCGLNIIARKDQDGRHEDCPLVELPPHGRLIDADKLRMKYEYGAEREKVDDAPTVLEASED